ncbi:restriction endonuclease subunit S [Marinirhabdus gelatinilytica]|uniref:Type I restriction enzyme S subunit n=1 Tax=Marinirhabdus gelatinilytica TaxID=1703343 RepID=A0A370QAR2_9FLAO|nr:restriction endonuclease subunit S [Marinirhabdus gelatinilytica]RDK85453.1 type I restriction enzyme S subunit [Marinirhabdus gelatinilytica]
MSEQLKPELRFPEFDGDWGETTFDSHYSFKPTNSFSRDKLNYEAGTVKNIHYGDIHTEFDLLFDVTKEKVPFINDDVNIENIDDENYVQKGDLVIADASEDYADIGKAIEVINTNNERLLAGLHTFLARREDDEVAEGFFAFLLNTYKARYEIMRIAQGTKVLGLSKNRLGEIPLYIPEPNEQQKIANFLKAIDKRIKLLKAKKDALEEYKTSIMQKLFAQEIRFKQDDGSDFPEWEEKRIDEIFDVTRGNVLAVPEMSDLQTEEYKYPVYSSQTKLDGLTGYYKEFLYQDAITWTTDGANAGEVKFRKGKFYCTNVCGVLLSTDGYANSCIAQLLNKVTHRYVSYVGNPKLMNNVMAGVKIEFPHTDEQAKIAEFIDSIKVKVDALSYKIEEIENYKESVLQKMFV